MKRIGNLPLPQHWERLPDGSSDVDREPLVCRYCGARDVHAEVLQPAAERMRVLAHQIRCDDRSADEPATEEELQAFHGFHSIRLLRSIRIREGILKSTLQQTRALRWWSFLRRRDLRSQVADIRAEIAEVREQAAELGLPEDWEGQAMIRAVGLDPAVFRVVATHRR